MGKTISMSLLVVLCGCATLEPGNPLTEENISQYVSRIQVQKTKQEEVRNLLGNPAKVLEFANLQREVWDFPYGREPRRMILSVQFSRDGVAREVLNMTDPADQISNYGAGSGP
jgi:outer membrane protein assembly factor BamE (lipoprotein component of BamABCDE complex)